MSTYRLLADHYVGTAYFLAGTIQSTADVPGGMLPLNWQPSGACEPLDTPAVNAFYAQGPQTLPLVRSRWTGIFVPRPVTYWQVISNGPGFNTYQLTGLGSGLPPISM
jgi:hypothetical protein